METRTTRWRFVPLLTALAVSVTAAFVGFGILISLPAAVVANVLAFRRTAHPRGLVFWLGTLANAIVTAVGIYILAALGVLLGSAD